MDEQVSKIAQKGVNMRTIITFDKVCDRQDLIPLMETRKRGLEPYMMDRTDMFWAKVHITDDFLNADLSYCIDHGYGGNFGTFTLSLQYGSKLLDSSSIREKILTKWYQSEECQLALKWIANLTEAGYYDHGCIGAPKLNAGRCPHCWGSWERGTSHPHTYLLDWNHKGEKRLIHHHKLMEKTIKELGLTKMGVSGLPDIPSLEELGELEPVIVQ